MARRVAVDLVLEAGRYLAEAKAAEQQTAKLDREMGQLDRSIDKVDRSFVTYAVVATEATRKTDALADQARDAAAAMTLLDARIAATRTSVSHLRMEFARTGDEIDGKNLSREESLLRRLEKLKKTLQEVTPDVSTVAKTATSSAASGGSGLGRLSATNPYVLAAGATAITAVGPALAAMIAGLIGGAIGTVGVAGGLAAAAKNPQVQAEAKRVGNVIATEFFRAGDAFLAPAMQGLGIIEKAFLGLKLPESLAKVAPDVQIIAQGFGDMATNIMPGFNKALDRMGPFADAAADGFRQMGATLGQFIDDVTASPGAVMGLRTTFIAIDATIGFLGKNIKFLSDAYAGLIAMGAKLGQSDVIKFLSLGMSDKPSAAMQRWLDALGKVPPTVDAAYGAALKAAAGVGVFGEAADGAALAAYRLNTAANNVYDTFLLLEGDEVAVEAAIDNLSDAFDRHGTSLDKGTKAGQENVTNLITIAETAKRTVADMLAHGKSVEEVTGKYDQFRQELYDAFIQAGKTAEEAQELVDKWLALQVLDDIEKTVTIRYKQIDAYLAGDIPHGFQQFAFGGTVQGPPGSAQMVIAHAGEVVLTKEQQGQKAQQWGGSTTWGGSDRTITVIVKDTSGRTLRTEMITDALNRNVPEATVRAAFP